MGGIKNPRRELVTLAQPIKKERGGKKVKPPDITGWLFSEKLDGTRCLWDGGLTRGMRTQDVPWASLLHPKTLQPKDKIKPISTGLWSRSGNPIIAPDWFLDALPPVMLDGELWAGRGEFQRCRSIVSGDEADDRWDEIEYKVYGAPSLQALTTPGIIKSNTVYIKVPETALQDMLARISKEELTLGWAEPDAPFAAAIDQLHEAIEDNQIVSVHTQRFLPDTDAWAAADELFENLLAVGAEGAIIRNPHAPYEIKRTHNLLKYKPTQDDEGVLVGFTAGEGKYEGKIGALILDYNGKRLKLSGMSDEKRTLLSELCAEPGKPIPDVVRTAHFTVGDVIEFAYRELSDAGIPKEGRFMRVKDNLN